MEVLAPIPPIQRNAALFADRRSLACAGRSSQSGILLVLLHQRTRSAVSGQALSQGLQQASRDRLLDAALCMAFSLEPVPRSSDRELTATCQRAHCLRMELCRSDARDLSGLVGSDPCLLRDLYQPGVLHVSCVSAAAAAGRRRIGLGPRCE